MVLQKNIFHQKKILNLYIPVLIATFYLFIAIASVQYDDITFDEGKHLYYGIGILKLHSDRYINGIDKLRSTMPVTALNALPRATEQLFNPRIKKNDWGTSDIKNGRYITIFVTLILLLYCFNFSKSLSNESVGCIIMLLIATDPNILAHSRLVTTDIYGTIGFIATLYHLFKWLAQKQDRHFYYFCIAIAVAQCCKPNNILLYGIVLVTVIFYSFQNRVSLSLLLIFKRLFIFALIQIIIINAAFLFAGFGNSLYSISLKSNYFKSLQSLWISKIPIPLPISYIETFDLVQYELESFKGTALNYLMGHLRYKQGFWNYYLICYSLKTPIITILLTTTGIIYSCIKKNIRETAFLFGWFPCIVILFFLSSSSIQNGYRYLLPATCILIIFSSFILEFLLQKFIYTTSLFFSVVPVLITLMAFPNYLAYTNEFVSDKRLAYKYFADSNLNWGQRNTSLVRFLTKNPEYIFEPSTPVTGKIVVDINNLTGIKEPEKFMWLRDNYMPVGTIDNCYLIFDIKNLPDK